MSDKNDFPEDFNYAVRDADARFEPHELKNPIPWPLIAIAVALAVWGGSTLLLDARATKQGSDAQRLRDAEAQNTASVATTPADKEAAEGDTVSPSAASLFQTFCATCHQANGSGVRGAIPPLDGSRYVLAEPQVPVAILLRGIAGPIEVKGELYNGRMPTFHATLSDGQIARILTYVRGAWSNDAGDLAEADVAEMRSTLSAELSQPWIDGFALEDRFGVPAATPQSGEDTQ